MSADLRTIADEVRALPAVEKLRLAAATLELALQERSKSRLRLAHSIAQIALFDVEATDRRAAAGVWT